MKTIYVYYINNGKILNEEVTSELQLAHLKNMYTNELFYNRADAIEYLNKPMEQKIHFLTEEEIKEQNEWGREQMTDYDRVCARELKDKQPKTLKQMDYEQFLFAMREMNITGKEFYKKRDAFWNRRDKEYAKGIA